MNDQETLSAELHDQNQWAIDNPDAWLSLLLDVEALDDCQPQNI